MTNLLCQSRSVAPGDGLAQSLEEALELGHAFAELA